MPSFKYAHLADLHLGSWREEKMRHLSTQAFLTALDQCVQSKVDFILSAGDLFNTSLPALDTLKIVTKKLKELHTQGIPLYVIAGSHDFSPSGKTMIDVLENAGLLKNVCQGTVNPETQKLHLQFTIDQKTGAKITGILGRKGQLDKSYYQNLALENLESEAGYKIFMFHTTVSELKPKEMEKVESQPASFLPKRFQYYAGGHIHHPTKVELPEYGILTYPGALFPNTFAEIEKYSPGGYYMIDVVEEQQQVQWMPLEVIKHRAIEVQCRHHTPDMVAFEILNCCNNIDLANTLVTIRLTGSLERGRVSDINFKDIFERLYQQGAYFIMKNTAQLVAEEFEEIKIASAAPENVEEEIIKEHLQQIKFFTAEMELQMTKSLLAVLNTTKKEGETMTDFQQRVESDVNKLLVIEKLE